MIVTETDNLFDIITNARSNGENGGTVLYCGGLEDLDLDVYIQQKLIRSYTIESREHYAGDDPSKYTFFKVIKYVV